MCGFAGFIDARAATERAALEAAARQMTQAVWHRGPDDGGVWADPKAGIAIGHRRLSILDLSIAGHQPMLSPTGRFVIAYNGEIYNCEELRQNLLRDNPNVRFRGHSDTEIILAAFEQWGLESSLQRMNGMFAFALWDQEDRALTLARDRFGEKPLYFGWSAQNYFLFGSELKALRAHWAFDAEIDRDALALYMRFNSIPAPESIYKKIQKLPPACILRYSDRKVEIKSYWSLHACVQRAISKPFRGSAQEAATQLDHLLRDAIKLRMNADVPLGAFLSGGIDSSLLVALMQAQSTKPVRTFTIGFYDPAYDEAHHARFIAHHLQTEHTELYVTPDQAMDVVSSLPEVYDEPFADSSQIPTLLVSRLTRQHVTVSLSGDGGDEIFGGYNRYTWGGRLWRHFSRVPHWMRRALSTGATAIGPQIWDAVFDRTGPVLPRNWRQRMPGYKLHKLADLLRSTSALDMYGRMTSHWLNPELVVLGVEAPSPRHAASEDWLTTQDFESQAMYLDTMTYLPDDILVKLDRATMSVGLEGRVPYLDARVLEFAWSLPQNMKVRPNEGKWLLRQVLYQYVPRQLVERPKMGFGIPVDSWLRGPMREWAEGLLDPHRLQQDGFLNTQAVRQKWDDHLAGRGVWQYQLWGVLMFQLWLKHQKWTPGFQQTPAAVQVGA